MDNYKNLENLRSRFLKEDESNIGEIFELVNKTCQKFNQKPIKGNTYINQPYFNQSELDGFEEIPQKGLKSEEVMDGIVRVMNGQIKWNSSSVLHNINPPACLETIASSCVANIYNPNPLWDFVSSGSQEMEKQVIRQISRLIGWNESNSDGVFTFGGKGCLTYAVKLGLNRALKANAKKGVFSVAQKPPVVIASAESHYSIDTVCSLLGIGTDYCIRVKVNKFGEMDIDDFRKKFNELVDNGNPIAAIIIDGGNTLNNSVDNIEDVIKIVEKRKRDINYKPYIHFDMVIGWAWLFYKGYDFNSNELKLNAEALTKIRDMTNKIVKCELADSVGLDFHKIGFTPYISSLFIVKDKAELHSIFKESLNIECRKNYGNNFLQHHMIEHSRTSDSIFSAWTALQSIGIEGFRKYIANLISVANVFRNEMPKYDFECLNEYSLAFATAFFPKYNKYSIEDIKNGKFDGNVEEVNNYVYNLFEYIYKGEHQYNKYVLGFLPKCEITISEQPISGLRVFPMSVHIDEEKAKNMCNELGKIKMEFDKIYNRNDYVLNLNKPVHVPK